jgi:hypothetical protein
MVTIYDIRRGTQERRHGPGRAMTLSALRYFSDDGRLNLFEFILLHLPTPGVGRSLQSRS